MRPKPRSGQLYACPGERSTPQDPDCGLVCKRCKHGGAWWNRFGQRSVEPRSWHREVPTAYAGLRRRSPTRAWTYRRGVRRVTTDATHDDGSSQAV
jgi:hypothetical protein